MPKPVDTKWLGPVVNGDSEVPTWHSGSPQPPPKNTCILEIERHVRQKKATIPSNRTARQWGVWLIDWAARVETFPSTFENDPGAWEAWEGRRLNSTGGMADLPVLLHPLVFVVIAHKTVGSIRTHSASAWLGRRAADVLSQALPSSGPSSNSVSKEGCRR